MSSILDRIRAKKLAAQQAMGDEPAPAVIQKPVQPVQPVAVQRTQTDPDVGPMMDLDEVTYLQLAFWDNGDKPREYKCQKTGKMKKRKGPRYKLSIEAWNVPAERIKKRSGYIQFVRNVQLRHPGPFRSAILDVNRASKKISEEYFKACARVTGQADDNDLLGLVFDRDSGWNYFENQFVHVHFTEEGVPVVNLHINGKVLTVDTFTDRFANASGVTHTAHVDRCGYQDFKKKDSD